MNNLEELLKTTEIDKNQKNNLKTILGTVETKTKTETGTEIETETETKTETKTEKKDNWEILKEETKKIRINQGMTQEELAQKAYCSQATISKMERTGCVSLYTLIKITESLGCEIHIIK